MKPGWRLAPFDSVMADESGGNLKTPQSEFLPAGRYAVVDQGKQLVAGYVNDQSRLCRVELPAIVFGDHTRCFKYVDFPFCMGADGTKVLRPKIDADVKYLYHYLRQLRLTEGGYDRHFKYLKRTEIVLPTLPEQRRIAALLDQAEALRGKRLTALAQLDTLTQSIFLDMFGTEVETKPEVRLESIASLITKGTTPTSVGYAFADRGVPFVRVQNLVSGVVDWEGDILFIDSETHKALSRSHIHDGDVLVSIAGTIGRVAIVPSRAPELNCNQAVAVIRSSERAIPEFLAHWLQGKGAQRQMLGAQVTGTISNLSLTQLRDLRLAVPAMPVQREFASRLAAVERMRAGHRASLARFDALFAALQFHAFSGQV